MATDTTDTEVEYEQQLGTIDDALAQARAELSAMTDAASAADQLADENEEYSLHEVPGVGRYAVVRRTGWRALLKVIHDPRANIDFSANVYPAFDGVIGQNFKSPYLLDPLNDKYESYQHLRENIAAVRNFLMEHYYVDTPPGMTPEKAEQAINEIAKYVGKGLDNNYVFMGLLPNHKIGQPFISISEASAPGGAGAQYLYEKILEMHRQSNWVRPFSAVLALFGGHTPPDWMLPPAHETEFTALFSTDIVGNSHEQGPAEHLIEKGIAGVTALENARLKLIDQHQLAHVATDLSALGDQLLYSASTMQNVAQLSEPVRRDAIEIAKDILKKLKLSLGDINIKDGLNLPPKEDISTLGALKGVAGIYERMLGWARGIDPTILQHPTVRAATQAIGQMGYLAKLEALRMAKLAKNDKLTAELAEQISKLPPTYSQGEEKKFGQLLDKVESGINVLMTRVQTISGPAAQIGHSASNELGSSINKTPTAGLGMQAGATGNRAGDDAAKRNAQIAGMQVATQQVQAARSQAQAKASGTETGQTKARTSIGRSLMQTMRVRGTPVQSSSSSSSSPTNPNNPAQRNANNAHLHHLHHEQEEHEQLEKQRLEMQRIQQAQQRAAKAAAKIDASLLKGFKSATDTKGMGPVMHHKKPVAPAPLKTEATEPKTGTAVTAPKSFEDEKKPGYPLPPTRGGGGRGF